MFFIEAAILLGLLLALSIIDIKSFRLPNILTFALIASGLFFAALVPDKFWDAVFGTVLGYGIFFVIELTYRRLRGQDGLGRGDAKLLAGGGAWCGWFGLPFIILIGSGMGLIAALFPSIRSRNKIPFGPFLSLGIFIVWVSFQLEPVF